MPALPAAGSVPACAVRLTMRPLVGLVRFSGGSTMPRWKSGGIAACCISSWQTLCSLSPAQQGTMRQRPDHAMPGAHCSAVPLP